MSASPIHRRLREATAEQHCRLEALADVEGRLRDLARRAGMIEGLLSFHREAEDRLEAHDVEIGLAGFERAGRAAALEGGLAVLGTPGRGSPGRVADTDLSTALGWLYVAEGSALGGRVMRKSMVRDGIDLSGLGFLDLPGDRTSARWVACMTLIEDAVNGGRADPDLVVQGAVAAFDRAHALLVPVSIESGVE